MMHARTIAGFLVLAIAAIAQADEIRLAPEEIENLGIRFNTASLPAGF